MLQTAVTTDFNSPDSWVILSSIEQSIKNKIEKVGTPLKDWNTQINYGIKTGCNEAFIISTKKREEILANCSDAEERHRTAELIRPILRGRDIKRYSYEWKGLWLINVHNGIKGILKAVNIEDYPAVKKWLDDGGVAYNGKRYKGFSQLSKRSDQGDTPYNLRSCAYLDDFNLPKIIWAELSRTGNSFVLDDDKYFVGNTGYILTSKELDRSRLQYLLGILNSRITLYQIDRLTTRFDDNGWRWLRQFVELLRVPPFLDFERITSIIATTNSSNQKEKSELLNCIIYEIYNLSPSEIEYINNSLAPY